MSIEQVGNFQKTKKGEWAPIETPIHEPEPRTETARVERLTFRQILLLAEVAGKMFVWEEK